MNLLAPVSRIMTTNLVTVKPTDKLTRIKEIFDEKKIHHVPVVKGKQMVGIISKQDFLYYLHGFTESGRVMGIEALESATCDKIMTSGLAKLEPDSRINVALEVFKENLFHALPVVDGKNLVGIITTYDIIKELAEEPITLEDYKDSSQ
jgi:acetoin utilization protein AcuB